MELPEVLITGRQHAKILIYQEETGCMMKEQKTCTHPLGETFPYAPFTGPTIPDG